MENPSLNKIRQSTSFAAYFGELESLWPSIAGVPNLKDGSTCPKEENLLNPGRAQLDDNELGMRPNEHSKLGPGWIRILYIAHKCDTIGRSKPVIRQPQNYYHPKEHDNEKVLKCPKI